MTINQPKLVIVCEHASNVIPSEYNNLGLSDEALKSHIAWDPGAHPIAIALSKEFTAPLVISPVSRLLYDCNRPPTSPTAIVERGENTIIPGNQGLTKSQKQRRAEKFYYPFSQKLAQTLDEATKNNNQLALVTIHSFTRVFKGIERMVELGVLHDDDALLADKILLSAKNDGDINVQANEPYSAADGVTHTLKKHAISRGLLNVMFEIRSDLIETTQSQNDMAQRLARYLRNALDS